MARQTQVIFPARSPLGAAGGQQPTLPPCRAWRIIARTAADFASGMAVVDEAKIGAAPSNARAGEYPVWVRCTNPSNDQERPDLTFVSHDGWIPEATGKNWRIEYVGSTSEAANTQQYVYIVEMIDDLDSAGQVNTPAEIIQAGDEFERWTVATGTAINTSNVLPTPNHSFLKPAGATRLDIMYAGPATLSGGGGLRAVLGDIDAYGIIRLLTASPLALVAAGGTTDYDGISHFVSFGRDGVPGTSAGIALPIFRTHLMPAKGVYVQLSATGLPPQSMPSAGLFIARWG